MVEAFRRIDVAADASHMGLQRRTIGRIGRLVILTLLCGAPAFPQTLAHRNWEGSGLTAQAWWTRATFCEVDPHLDPGKSLHSVTAHLDDFQSIGCDALVLDMLSADTGSPVALSSGTLDDADELIGQMGRRKIRLVLHLPLAGQGSLDRMRFWLSRGVSGFVLRCEDGLSGADAATLLHQAHQVTAAALGGRILITEGIAPPASGPGVRHAAEVQLGIRRIALEGPTSALRAALNTKGSPLPLLAAESSGSPQPSAQTRMEVDRLRIQAAVLFGNGTATLLPPEALTVFAAAHRASTTTIAPAADLPLWVPEGGEPLGDDLLTWYRSLADLRHTSPALRTGEPTYLNRDTEGVLAWIIRPKGPGTPLLFICNVSGHPVHLSLTSDLRALSVRGNTLHTLLSSELEPAQPTIDAIRLPESGVLAAELR